jgi:spermidine synthase
MKEFPVMSRTESERSLALLIVLFAGSGAAALIYEIVWFQLLQLVIGSTALSLGVLLGTFMGGMCLGSLASPRVISQKHHPLRVYAVLELGIAGIGLLVLFGMVHIGEVYAVIAGYGRWNTLARVGIPAIFLLPPTILMGATLPAIGRWVEANPRGVSWLGLFYGGNIVGAVFGCLSTGFYLLRVYDVTVATDVAAAINVCVAATAFLLARKRITAVGKNTFEGEPFRTVPGAWTVYVTIALSGLAALGAEAVWTRILSLTLGASTYTFSIILAVFLIGLGMGSSAGSAVARWSADPRRDLGISQMLAAAGVAWSAYMLSASLPYWPIDPTLTRGPWLDFQLDVFRSALAVLPAASTRQIR